MANQPRLRRAPETAGNGGVFGKLGDRQASSAKQRLQSRKADARHRRYGTRRCNCHVVHTTARSVIERFDMIDATRRQKPTLSRLPNALFRKGIVRRATAKWRSAIPQSEYDIG